MLLLELNVVYNNFSLDAYVIFGTTLLVFDIYINFTK